MDRSANPRLQLVIVALPAEHDQVRKFSSEKEPHLTLLYLGGENFDQSQIDRIVGYVQHASSQMVPFGLSVESRGELGDKHADVLFFQQNWAKQIADFRNNLLQNELISQAYLSADQFPEWTPHLTMGYPDNPAKKDTREYPGFDYVSFDRIAVWTGDSTGPTFRLKPQDFHMDGELAMSQIDRGRSVVDDHIKHYGTKGMKWGVRRSDSGSSGGGSKSTVSDDHKSAVDAQKKINSGGTKVLSNKELQGLIQRKNLEKQYRDLHANDKSSMDIGNAKVKKILGYGKTLNEVNEFLKTPMGRKVKMGFKVAGMAAKVGAAYASGGTSAAAGAAGTIAVRRMANHYSNVGN